MAPKASLLPLLDQTPLVASRPLRAIAAATSPEFNRADGVMIGAVDQRHDANLQPTSELGDSEGPAVSIDEQSHNSFEDSSYSQVDAGPTIGNGSLNDTSTVTTRTISSRQKSSLSRKGKSHVNYEFQHPIWCRLCEKTFWHEKEFIRHWSLHFPAYLCPFWQTGCRCVFKRTGPLRNHLKNFHGISKGVRNDRNYHKVERRHATGCVLCIRAFGRTLDYVKHHAAHCRAGFVKADASELLEVISLFNQTGLREYWRQAADRKVLNVGVFAQWCLQHCRDLCVQLEGDILLNWLPEHIQEVRALLEGLLRNYYLCCGFPLLARHATQVLSLLTQLGNVPANSPPLDPRKYLQPIGSAPRHFVATSPGHLVDSAAASRARRWNCLVSTVRSGLLPTFTQTGLDLHCGIYAVVGSMNEALPAEEQLNPMRVVQEMWPDRSRPSPAYRAFLQEHLSRSLEPGTAPEVRQMALQELEAPNNLSAEQLQIIPAFLRRRGMLKRDFVVGMVVEGGRARDGRVVDEAVLLDDSRPEAFVVWVHNDNAQLLLGGQLNHWSMFSRAPNRLQGALSSLGLAEFMVDDRSTPTQPSAGNVGCDFVQYPAPGPMLVETNTFAAAGNHHHHPPPTGPPTSAQAYQHRLPQGELSSSMMTTPYGAGDPFSLSNNITAAAIDLDADVPHALGNIHSAFDNTSDPTPAWDDLLDFDD